ncbi:MAG TPA: hypothetical protein VEX64_09080, partial [Pyrinomonadaceae bacterium]|nr:hypothetical protein [Pyrinomonadaceae bacterium]
LGGVLLYSATAATHIDDASLFRTFWAASGIMLLAFLLSLYFVRTNGRETAAVEGLFSEKLP